MYVVDDKNTVQYRRVTTGPLESDGLRVIEDGARRPTTWSWWVRCNRFARACRSCREKIPMPSLGAAEQDEEEKPITAE